MQREAGSASVDLVPAGADLASAKGSHGGNAAGGSMDAHSMRLLPRTVRAVTSSVTRHPLNEIGAAASAGVADLNRLDAGFALRLAQVGGQLGSVGGAQHEAEGGEDDVEQEPASRLWLVVNRRLEQLIVAEREEGRDLLVPGAAHHVSLQSNARRVRECEERR